MSQHVRNHRKYRQGRASILVVRCLRQGLQDGIKILFGAIEAPLHCGRGYKDDLR